MRPLRPLFFASFVFSFHLALLSYLNSSVLDAHTRGLSTALIYTTASLLSLLLVVVGPRLAKHFGASRFLYTLLLISAVLLCLLGTSLEASHFGLIFILYFSLNSVIWYAFDLVIEHYSRESNTGNIRGLYLTLNNAGWVAAPVIASVVASTGGFARTYILACVAVTLSYLVIKYTPKVTSSTYAPNLSLSLAFKELIRHAQARRLVALYFLLQFFFAWMVIYVAPYLLSLGFNWTVIGVILSVMLLPFVLLQYGTGKLADRMHNEKFLIISGFSIMAVSTFFLGLPLAPKAALFASILFLTRVGASIVEVSIESAFFKEVNEKDTALISTLRMTLPLAYIIAPFIGSLIIRTGTYQTIFTVLSLIVLGTVLYSFRLRPQQRS